MHRIQRLSTYVLLSTQILIIYKIISTVLLWGFIDHPILKPYVANGDILKPFQTPEGVINFSQVNWNTLSKTIGFCADVIYLLPFLLGLFVLRKIFKNYQRGKIFTTTNARLYQYLGWFFFFDALFSKPVGGVILTIATTISNPPGHRWLTLNFGTPNLEALFCGAILIIVSWVMLEGSKLNEENTLTI